MVNGFGRILLCCYILIIELTGEANICYVELHPNAWNSNKFVENGSPIVTLENEDQFVGTQSLTFIPKYTVLESKLDDEENVYVKLTQMSNVLLHLYGSKHPEAPNYRINITSFTIENCENTQACRPVDYCVRGQIIYDNISKLSENVVYVSWKKTKEQRITIVVQHKINFLRCYHTNDLIIKKFVMYGPEQQDVSTSRHYFSVSHTVGELQLADNFTLCNDSSIHLQILQCPDCNVQITLTCGESECDPFVVKGSDGPKMVFQNSLISHGWNNVMFARSEGHDCNLRIRKNKSVTINEEFWNIDRIFVREGSAGFRLKCTEPKKPEDPVIITNSTDDPTGPKDLNAGGGMPTWILVLITILIIAIVTLVGIIIFLKRHAICGSYGPIPQNNAADIQMINLEGPSSSRENDDKEDEAKLQSTGSQIIGSTGKHLDVQQTNGSQGESDSKKNQGESQPSDPEDNSLQENPDNARGAAQRSQETLHLVGEYSKNRGLYTLGT